MFIFFLSKPEQNMSCPNSLSKLISYVGQLFGQLIFQATIFLFTHSLPSQITLSLPKSKLSFQGFMLVSLAPTVSWHRRRSGPLLSPWSSDEALSGLPHPWAEEGVSHTRPLDASHRVFVVMISWENMGCGWWWFDVDESPRKIGIWWDVI